MATFTRVKLGTQYVPHRYLSDLLRSSPFALQEDLQPRLKQSKFDEDTGSNSGQNSVFSLKRLRSLLFRYVIRTHQE